jgi:CRISPR-associated protein Cmr3
MNNAKLWCFEALDSWFFRESRPHGTVGGSELASVFPPPARTIAGAVRTLIGATQGVNWEQYPAAYPDLEQQIGNANGLGKLQLRGPYLLKDGQRLYPVPLHLLGKSIPSANGTDTDDEKWEFICLHPGNPVECDLGKVRLPVLEQPLPGAKPLENVWLHGADLTLVLKGEKPNHLYRKRELLVEEPRLGIARHYGRRTVEESLLYQTRHIRLHEGVALGVMVSGIDPAFHPAGGLLRCGGEGRLGAVTVLEPPQDSLFAPPQPVANRLLLVLLTHADFSGGWLPPGFKAEKENGIHIWQGEINKIKLTIQAAAVGKLVREGGWDLSKQRPRPVIGLVPAGSAYFCTVDGDPQMAVTALHSKSIGNNTELGHGELAVGLW